MLASEGFSAVIRDSMAKGLIQGVRVSPRAPHVSHLLFADGTLIFCKATPNTGNSLATVLQAYCNASGQLINYTKSQLAFGVKVPDPIRISIEEGLHI